jgi:hypothetical protein
LGDPYHPPVRPSPSPRRGLALPVSGIPIRSLRSYASRDQRQGDFGVGWNRAIQTFRVSATRVLGSGWRVIIDRL